MCGTCGCGENKDGIRMNIPNFENEKSQTMHHHHHHGHDHHHHHHESHAHEHDLSEKVIKVEKDIMSQNALLAQHNMGFFEGRDILAINLVSSPGSGKTSLLERTIKDTKKDFSYYVIEGDQQTMNDANRIAALEIPVIQINTGKACHLDASMVNEAVKKLNPEAHSILFIENVGNLVCPAMFDLGERKRIVIMSVTEGDDKAIKYPDMFHSSQLCIINKIDLLPYVDFDVDRAKEYARRVNPELEFIEVSATKGDGMGLWYEWLEKVMQAV